MLTEFKNFIQKNKLFSPSDFVLLTVSGGIDSVVLFDLFLKSGFRFGVAHCNFGLRGEESNLDEIFVRNLSKSYEIPFYSILFETKKFAKENKISTQMAARQLRYAWFEKIMYEENYQFVATAHQKNDVIETIFLNLIRGTGMKGLEGIPLKNNHIIRPLLFASRSEISNYAQSNQITWREDQSNQENHYKRNLLRNQIIPLMQQINPNLENTLLESMEKIGKIGAWFQQNIEEIKKHVITQKGETIQIEIAYFQQIHQAEIQLFEIIKEFNFQYSQAKQIIKSIQHIAGKVFHSETHTLLRDRKYWLIQKKHQVNQESNFWIEVDEHVIENNLFTLQIDYCTKDNSFQIPLENNIACLDLDALAFPLHIRKWQQGDYFFPLGMKQKKKISDFLIDAKINLHDKNNVFVLCSGEEIVWVMGYRIDNRFKITDATTSIIKIKYAK